MPPELTLLSDKDWEAYERLVWLVDDFRHFTAPGKGHPYASVEIESEKGHRATGFITHRVDFEHLQSAFNERQEGEEVILVWTRESLKRVARLASRFMPKLEVWVCPPGAFALMTNPSSKPELQGTEWFEATAPRVKWKPSVMD